MATDTEVNTTETSLLRNNSKEKVAGEKGKKRVNGTIFLQFSALTGTLQ